MFAFMKKGFLACFIFLFSIVTNGQSAFFQQVDTLKSIHRTGGRVDTISKCMESFQSTFFVSPYGTQVSPFQLYSSNEGYLHRLKVKEHPLVFSALPHLGFLYGFGSQGSQRLKVDFQEAFRHNILVNVSFDKTKGNGFLRNDDFSLQEFNARVNKKGTHYSMDLQTGNEAVNRSWSNGLLSAVPIEGIELNLQSVRKENARSNQALSFVRWQHRYDFAKDSTRGIGLYAKHEFFESKRDYYEEADLVSIYPNTFWDTDSTFDVFRERGIMNDIGVFFNAQHLELQSSLNHCLRSWRDHSNLRDTNEVWLNNELAYRSNVFQVEHQDAFNLYGASNGFTSNTKVSLPLVSLKVHIIHRISSVLPELMQRNYFSNNVQYALGSLEKQWNHSLQFSIEKSIGSIDLEAAYQFLQFRNVYLFDQSLGTWRNETWASQGFGQRLIASASWTKKGFLIRPAYRWTHFTEGLNFQPQHDASLHVQWRGGVFKAKKLRMLFAADARYAGSFQQREFIPQMGVFDMLQTTNLSQNGFANLSFTTALEVETFRFFVCVDNLSSYWTSSQTAFIPNYVFPTMQIKIGLTWDFWN